MMSREYVLKSSTQQLNEDEVRCLGVEALLATLLFEIRVEDLNAVQSLASPVLSVEQSRLDLGRGVSVQPFEFRIELRGIHLKTRQFKQPPHSNNEIVLILERLRVLRFPPTDRPRPS